MTRLHMLRFSGLCKLVQLKDFVNEYQGEAVGLFSDRVSGSLNVRALVNRCIGCLLENSRANSTGTALIYQCLGAWLFVAKRSEKSSVMVSFCVLTHDDAPVMRNRDHSDDYRALPPSKQDFDCQSH